MQRMARAGMKTPLAAACGCSRGFSSGGFNLQMAAGLTEIRSLSHGALISFGGRARLGHALRGALQGQAPALAASSSLAHLQEQGVGSPVPLIIPPYRK